MTNTTRSTPVVAVVLLAVAACTGSSEPTASAAPTATPAAPASASNCQPLETRERNVPEQKPAFPGQTRACAVSANVAFDVVVLARLEKPWAVEPMANGDLLVTEKAGRMRIVSAKGQLGEPIAGGPAVDARGQGGLLDVALGPTFESDRTIYWSYSEPRQGGNATSLARGVLIEDGKVTGEEHLLRDRGQRVRDVRQGPDGALYVVTDEQAGELWRIAPRR